MARELEEKRKRLLTMAVPVLIVFGIFGFSASTIGRLVEADTASVSPTPVQTEPHSSEPFTKTKPDPTAHRPDLENNNGAPTSAEKAQPESTINKGNSPLEEKTVGWLHCSIGPCQFQGDGTVGCDGSLRNADSSDHGLMTFVAQTGGIRNMALARYGIATAYDTNGRSYEATSITIANQASGETGQFQVNMLSGLTTPFSIYFGGVPADARLFYRIRIPVLVKNNSFQLSGDSVAIGE